MFVHRFYVRQRKGMHAPMISYNAQDYAPFTMIPVIASFSDDGHIRPLYVRIKGETYKVDSYWVRCHFRNRMEFNCKLIVNNFLQPLVITYHLDSCIWTTPKLMEDD
jgi:hypothetical protein